MKIAVTYENGNVYGHFGHTEQFKLYEVENGKFSMSVVVKNPKPVREFVTRFKKFRHLTDEDIEGLQQLTDVRYARLQKLCQE